jgi:predicted protein tyrosine phosphatase
MLTRLREQPAKVIAEQTKRLILDLFQIPLQFQPLLEHCCAGISPTMAWGDESPEKAKVTVTRSDEMLEGISPGSIE